MHNVKYGNAAIKQFPFINAKVIEIAEITITLLLTGFIKLQN